jgi:uncharacterized FlaG/YvyC family protein
MALEIGLPINPASAISSVKTARAHDTLGSGSSNETRFEVDDLFSASQNESGAPNVTVLRDAVSQLNKSVQNVRRELQFSVDEETGRVVVRVIDAVAGETIRQIPAEELLQLARHFKDNGTVGGNLLKVRA